MCIAFVFEKGLNNQTFVKYIKYESANYNPMTLGDILPKFEGTVRSAFNQL